MTDYIFSMGRNCGKNLIESLIRAHIESFGSIEYEDIVKIVETVKKKSEKENEIY